MLSRPDSFSSAPRWPPMPSAQGPPLTPTGGPEKEKLRRSKREKRGMQEGAGGYTDSVIPTKGFSAQLQSALQQREAELEEEKNMKNLKMAAEVRANADPTRSSRPKDGGPEDMKKDPHVQAAQMQAMGQLMATQSMQVNKAGPVAYMPVPSVPVPPPGGAATPVPPRSGSFAAYVPPPMPPPPGPMMPYAPPNSGPAMGPPMVGPPPVPGMLSAGYASTMAQLQSLASFSQPTAVPALPATPVPTPGACASAPMHTAQCARISYVPPAAMAAPGSGSYVPVAPGGPVLTPSMPPPGSGSFVPIAPGGPVLTPAMPPPGAALASTPRGPPPAHVPGGSVCIAPPMPGPMPGLGSFAAPPMIPTTPVGSYVPPAILAAPGGSSFVPPTVPALNLGASLSRSGSFIGPPVTQCGGISRTNSFVGPPLPGAGLSQSMAAGSLTPRAGPPPPAAGLPVSRAGSFIAGPPVPATPGMGSMRLPPNTGSVALTPGGCGQGYGGPSVQTTAPPGSSLTGSTTSFVAMQTGGYPALAPSLAAHAAMKAATFEERERGGFSKMGALPGAQAPGTSPWASQHSQVATQVKSASSFQAKPTTGKSPWHTNSSIASQLDAASLMEARRMTNLSRAATHKRAEKEAERSVTPRRSTTFGSGPTPVSTPARTTRADRPAFTPTRVDPVALMNSPDMIRWPRLPA
mmetsp:Transcript_58397/g.139256  ORF Transcript_58397/g.139256 Transcript_58397/m.139256 type:complete len:690 (+) Transcript_58397:154-2223(+)